MSNIDVEKLARRCIGKRVEDAEVMCEVARIRYRTIKENGHGLMRTNDVRGDRINFIVNRGQVTGAHVG